MDISKIGEVYIHNIASFFWITELLFAIFILLIRKSIKNKNELFYFFSFFFFSSMYDFAAYNRILFNFERKDYVPIALLLPCLLNYFILGLEQSSSIILGRVKNTYLITLVNISGYVIFATAMYNFIFADILMIFFGIFSIICFLYYTYKFLVYNLSFAFTGNYDIRAILLFIFSVLGGKISFLASPTINFKIIGFNIFYFLPMLYYFINKYMQLVKEKEIAQQKLIENQKELIESYARFVPEQLLTFLGKNIITEINLGDSIQKEMTILFSDIRSFTTMSEGMTPDENFGFINSYMAVMGPCIRKHNGFIDKYIGDAIMALFPEKPSDAIDASIEMLEELHQLNLKRNEKGFKSISIGIGIHTGSQMLGIIGEEERLEGTVISDVVNTASRLEGLTKAYASSILISKDVMDKTENSEKYFYRHLDTVKVKGKNKAVEILEILNGNSQRIIELKIKLRPIFEQGIEYYSKKKFDKALENFKKVLMEDPKDKASELYVDRCEFYIKNGVSHEWDGVEKLDFK